MLPFNSSLSPLFMYCPQVNISHHNKAVWRNYFAPHGDVFWLWCVSGSFLMTSLCFQWPTSQCVLDSVSCLAAWITSGEYDPLGVCVCGVFGRTFYTESVCMLSIHVCLLMSLCLCSCVCTVCAGCAATLSSSTAQHSTGPGATLQTSCASLVSNQVIDHRDR